MQIPERQTDLTRQRIVEAALEVFAKKGYHGATMDEIASVSRVSKGGLYFHFPSKQDLFLALADVAANLLITKMTEAMQASGLRRREKMRLAIASVFDLLERHRTMARVVFLKMASLGPPFDRKLMEIHRRIARLIQKELEEAQKESRIPVGDSELVSLMWVGALHEVLVWWLHEPKPKPLMSAFPELYITLLRSIGLDPKGKDA
ncbi:MAG TPA: TetR/AcrR family transcriptional regulator [Candidatus Acidoferrales bacterium]|nr:TetR/AcrR family transcriptional regulator [Candidatus Acidoferrales bacterium]